MTLGIKPMTAFIRKVRRVFSTFDFGAIHILILSIVVTLTMIFGSLYYLFREITRIASMYS